MGHTVHWLSVYKIRGEVEYSRNEQAKIELLIALLKLILKMKPGNFNFALPVVLFCKDVRAIGNVTVRKI